MRRSNLTPTRIYINSRRLFLLLIALFRADSCSVLSSVCEGATSRLLKVRIPNNRIKQKIKLADQLHFDVKCLVY